MPPFKSDAQRKFFEANKAKLEKQGVNVDEWAQASKGMSLPERVIPKVKPTMPKMKKKKKASMMMSDNDGDE